MTEEANQKWISGFWRRIGALLIDSIILGVIGIVLGVFLENTFVQIGAWGRLVGFLIALVYFGVMNSTISGGQTLGKRVLKLRVVDSNNSSISFTKSLLRYSVIGVPFSLNGARLPNDVMFSPLIYPISLILFGGLCSIIYLYIFNRITRQSLHDLVVGSFVVNEKVENKETGKVWNVHLVIVGVLLIATALIPAFTGHLTKGNSFKGMISVQSKLLEVPNVSFASVTSGWSTFTSVKEGPKTSTYVSSEVLLETNNVKDVEFARRLALLVITNYPETLEKDIVQIKLLYGYDIGIASKWSSNSHNFNPIELRDGSKSEMNGMD